MNNQVKKYTLKEKIMAIGPGAMVTASFIGPGTVTTATRAGASFGYVLLWTVLFSIVATIILQQMAARLGIITQEGLGEAIVKQFDNPLMKKLSIWLVGFSITFGCASYISGDLTGTSLGIQALTGLPVQTIAPFIGVIVLILVTKGSLKFLERVLTGLVVIMAIVFITTMVAVKPDIGEIFKGSLTPTIPKGSIILIISMIGTTVVPYNFFLHASSAKENWSSPDELVLSRWDANVSISIGGIITAAIVITSAATMKGMAITNAADISIQLEPLLGSWAKVFTAIGLFAAGFSSAIATPLGASSTLAGLLGWKYNNSDKRYLYTNIIIVVIGTIVASLGLNPMTILLVAQALNGIILPVVAIYLVYITSSSKLMGEYKNSTFMKVAGVLISLVTIILGGYGLIDAISAFL